MKFYSVSVFPRITENFFRKMVSATEIHPEKRSGKLLNEDGSISFLLRKIIRFSGGYGNATLGTNELTHFMPLVSIRTPPKKHPKTKGLMFCFAFFVQGHLKYRWDLRATVWNDPISPATQWTFRSENNRTYWHVTNWAINANTVDINKNIDGDFNIWSHQYHGIWMILVMVTVLLGF